IRYFSTKQQLVDAVSTVLDDNPRTDIIISGVWARSLHESIIEMIIGKESSSSCKIIIPKLLFKGDISLNLLRNICKTGGQVRVNNTTTNNLMILGRYAIILSFSSRLNSLGVLSTSFECAVMTDDAEIVGSLRTQFEEVFENSVLFRM
ncbi:MAG TPA: hypothetical protein VN549_03730, partial [Negativicutes bacterium]|nr:hypothetical protein [Negativicutes bacterium]